MDRKSDNTIYPNSVILTTVPDDVVKEIYGVDLADSFNHPPYITKLIHHESRRLAFYMNDKGIGAEFSVATMHARIFLASDFKSGYASHFGDDKRGMLHTFNMQGNIQFLTGNWVNDPQTGEDVFVKSETAPEEEQRSYQNDNHAMRSMRAIGKFFLVNYPDQQPT